MNKESAQTSESGFHDFRQIVSRRKWTIAVCLAIALILDLVACLALQPLYRTTVRVFAQPSPERQSYNELDPERRMQMSPQTPEVQNQIEVLSSVSLLLQAFQNAGVQIPPEALDPNSRSNPIGVKEVGISDAVDISVDLPDPDSSVHVAQQIPKVFSDYLTAGEASDFSRTVGYLTDKLGTEQTRLDAAQVALAKFRGSHQTEAVGQQEAEAMTEKLSRAQGELETAKAALEDARQRYNVALNERLKQPEVVKSPTTVVNWEHIVQARQRLTDLNEKLADAETTYSDQSEQVRSLKAQVAQEEAYTKSLPSVEPNNALVKNPEIPQYDANLATERQTFEGAQRQVSTLQAEVNVDSAKLKNFAANQPTEQKLMTEIALRTTTVQDLSRELDEIRVKTTASHDPVTVLAVSQTKQVQPDPLKYSIIAIILGLAMGVLAALAKDKYDDRVFSLDQIYSISGVPPIGQLPSSKQTLALTAGHGRSALLENYRALRFNLDSIAEGGEPVQSVMVASPSGLERRPELVYNLAVEAATDQRSTILVDGDLRNPKLHEQLGLRLSPGLSDVLRGTVTLEEALQTTSNGKLRFLAAGSPTEDPIELLSSPALSDVHEELKKISDVIIVNSPSLLRHADGRAMAKVFDSVLFVARSGATKLAALRYCVDMLRRAKAPLLGIVLSESGGYSDVPYYGRD